MDIVKLKAILRKTTGKSACKTLRKEGLIPGVVYKDGKEAIAISVGRSDLWHALHTDAGENAIIAISIDGEKKKGERTAIVEELQIDPVNDRYLHVDFHEISLEDVIKVKVPVVLKGEAAGKKDGGVVNQVLWELEVECKAMDVPENIVVNVDNLKINDAIYVKNLELPAAVKAVSDAEQIVVGVNPPSAEEIPTPEAAAPLAGEEEPEVIKKGKKEEEEEAAEEAAEKKEAAPAPEKKEAPKEK